MTAIPRVPGRVVFLLDVDNTLLDNDQVTADLKHYLTREIGAQRQERYWAIFEELRTELGYADYLGALQRYRVERPSDSHVLCVSSYMLNYPFAERLYPRSLAVIRHLAQWGLTVIVTDGDVVFQPRKIERSGLYDAVEGRVLVYVHKEHALVDIEQRYPADHYVFVDDKIRLLSALKRVWGARLTTVFPRQGQYACDPRIATYPTPDVTIERIGDLLACAWPALMQASATTET